MLAAFDLFLEHIDSDIMCAREPVGRVVQEHLHEPRPAGVVPHPVADLISEHVTHQRLVQIGGIQHPVRVRRLPEQGCVNRLVERIAQFHRKRMLRIPARGVSAHFDHRAPVEIPRRIERRRSAGRGVDQIHRSDNVGVCRNGLAERLKANQRQTGIKPRQVRVEQCKAGNRHRARGCSANKTAGLHHAGIGKNDRRRIQQRIGNRQGSIQREPHLSRAPGQCDDRIARKHPASGCEGHEGGGIGRRHSAQSTGFRNPSRADQNRRQPLVIQFHSNETGRQLAAMPCGMACVRPPRPGRAYAGCAGRQSPVSRQKIGMSKNRN